jgi:hypothetical protein
VFIGRVSRTLSIRMMDAPRGPTWILGGVFPPRIDGHPSLFLDDACYGRAQQRLSTGGAFGTSVELDQLAICSIAASNSVLGNWRGGTRPERGVLGTSELGR